MESKNEIGTKIHNVPPMRIYGGLEEKYEKDVIEFVEREVYMRRMYDIFSIQLKRNMRQTIGALISDI